MKSALLLLPLLLGACSLERLSEVGRPPAMTPPADPTKAADYRPLTMPMPTPRPLEPQANALWRNGSRAFFKDQRAANVGDLVTILVQMADSADMENATSATRSSNQTMAAPALLGAERTLQHIAGVSGAASTSGGPSAGLVSANGGTGNTGAGTMKRNETVQLRLAGVITQVLPNANLVVAAHQEVRVNGELRDLQVSGVIRPQDIASDNTILHDRMAEARIAYGGRGQLTDVQSPRWGQQMMDIMLPF